LDVSPSGIWISLVLRVVFWPLIITFNPSTIISPEFGCKPARFTDYAELVRQQTKFMESPPACGSTVTYRAYNCYAEKSNAIFLFNAEVAREMAEIVVKDYQSLQGMHAAIRWTSLRNDAITTPTEVPDLLVNFDHIAEGLIEAGHGQVACLACNKTYATSEVTRKSGFIGGWLLAHYMCPAQHWLLSREIAHFMFKRNYE
jgi:hypothetical protein